jgi:hypothetical protein
MQQLLIFTLLENYIHILSNYSLPFLIRENI